MCGICGFTGHRNDQKAVIERMMKSIEHRGPDSEGSFCGGEITLGFRRLSIIDLEDGQQPMESADGNLQIVFNGEIYDYKELRAELEAAGISFRTHSDTEVLIPFRSTGKRPWTSCGECSDLLCGMRRSRL